MYKGPELTRMSSEGGQRRYYDPQPPCAPSFAIVRYLNHMITIYFDISSFLTATFTSPPAPFRLKLARILTPTRGGIGSFDQLLWEIKTLSGRANAEEWRVCPCHPRGGKQRLNRGHIEARYCFIKMGFKYPVDGCMSELRCADPIDTLEDTMVLDLVLSYARNDNAAAQAFRWLPGLSIVLWSILPGSWEQIRYITVNRKNSIPSIPYFVFGIVRCVYCCDVAPYKLKNFAIPMPAQVPDLLILAIRTVICLKWRFNNCKEAVKDSY